VTHSCVVSFAPGSGGHFVGSVCQYLLYNTEIKILPTGSAHSGTVKFWGHPDLVLENSGEAISHEIVLIKNKLQVSQGKVMVTHSRNLWNLSKKFNKTIYINFSESDIESIAKKYISKNPGQEICESNYNNIKDQSWPSFDDFLLGKAEPYVYDEVNYSITRSVYENWVWIAPAILRLHNIHTIQFSDIHNNDLRWLFDLIEFLEISTNTDHLEYLKEAWHTYKNYNELFK